jgi:hypothetical protein
MYLTVNAPIYVSLIHNKTVILLLLVGEIVLTGFTPTIVRSASAETGNGKDVFKVVMSVLGIDKFKGDAVSIVTVNDGEASKVKFLDMDKPANPGSDEKDIVEYVATFPNVAVSAGEQYKACVLPIKTLEPICTTGSNSPAPRPEFVDIILNGTSTPADNGPSDDD